MATRALVGIERHDGSIDTIYVHHGMDCKDVLKRDYRDLDKVEELISLGDASYIHSDLDDSFFYGRDRGDSDTDYVTYEDLEDLIVSNAESGIELVYIYSEPYHRWKTYEFGPLYRKFTR